MTIDPRTIAADIMCGNARSITAAEVWAHIGQAYDTAQIDAAIADEVAELIAKTGIDLIWTDGSKNTELDAARVEIERLRAEIDALTADIDERDAELSMMRTDLDFQTKAAWDNHSKVARLRSALALALAGKKHLWDDAKKDWVPLAEWAMADGDSRSEKAGVAQ